MSFSTRPSIHRITTGEHYSEHLAGRLLHLPGGGLPSQPDLHLVLGEGQRLLQEVKLWSGSLFTATSPHLSVSAFHQQLSCVVMLFLWWVFTREEWSNFELINKQTGTNVSAVIIWQKVWCSSYLARELARPFLPLNCPKRPINHLFQHVKYVLLNTQIRREVVKEIDVSPSPAN